MLVLAACPRAPLPAMRPVSSAPYSDEVLPSGLRLIVEPERGTGHVEVVLVVAAGWRHDPPGRDGLAHLVEHLALENRHPDGRTRLQRLEALGSQQFNGQTSLDTVRYFATVPRDRLAPLLALQTELLLSPLAGLTAEDLAREKSIVLTERETASPDVALFDGWLAGAGLAQRTRGTGTSESIPPIAPTDADAFVRAHYRPGRATLLVVGDFDVLDGRTEVYRALDPRLRAPGPPRPPPSPPRALAATVKPQAALPVVSARVAKETLVVGWPLAAAEVPDWLAGRVAATVEAATPLKPTFFAGTDDFRAVVGAVPRDPGLAPEDQLHDLAAAVERALATHRPLLRPALRHLAALEDWEQRGVERASHAQVFGPARLPVEETGVDLDPGALAAGVRDGMAAWRARGVVLTPKRLPAGALTPVPPAPAAPPPFTPETAARIAAVPDLAAMRGARLANGLPTVVLRRPDARLVTVALVRPGGQTRGKPGLAAIAEAAYDRDVKCPVLHGLSVDADDTTDWFTGPPGELACMLGAAAERATTPLDADGFAAAQRAFAGDLEKNAASAANARLYGDAWALWFPPAKAVNALTLADATAHLRALLDPTRSALVVVGPVDSDAVLAEAERTVGTWTRADAAPVALPAPFAPKARAPHVGFTADATAASVEVSMACLVPPAPPPNPLPRYVRAVLEARLWRTRHRLAASYGEATLQFWSAYAGHVSAATRVHPARLDATLREMKDALTAEPTAAELAEARWKVAHLMRRREAHGGRDVAGWLGQLMVAGVTYEGLRAANASVVAPTDDAVRIAWKQCAGGQQWMMVGDEAVMKPAAQAVFGEEALK